MIISGTVASPAAGPALPSWVNAPAGPADENPPNGASAFGSNGKWVASTCPGYVISALGTLAAGANIIDWTTAGLFTFTGNASAYSVTFINAAGVLTALPGQAIELFITGAAGTLTWTQASGITWCGSVAAGGGSTSAPVTTANTTSITLVCLTGGSSPTFLGTYITS